MVKRYHPFKVGRFDCTAIRDGSMNYPLDLLFANAPREQVEEALRERQLPVEHVTTPYTCLHIDTGEHRVLVDTGAGNSIVGIKNNLPTVDNTASTTGELPTNMKEAGLEPADVDTVIITHAHPDHIAGTLTDDGQLVYANAHYFISRAEWAYWMTDASWQAPEVMVQLARKNLQPLEGRITFVEDGDEVVPGVRALATPGHTPGHLALAIQSEGETLLHVSDLVLYPLHLEHPDWRPAFDIEPGRAAESKVRIFDQAAQEHALVFTHHFPPFPNLGRITRSKDGWNWQPVSSSD